jgi:hypothetical protein
MTVWPGVNSSRLLKRGMYRVERKGLVHTDQEVLLGHLSCLFRSSQLLLGYHDGM